MVWRISIIIGRKPISQPRLLRLQSYCQMLPSPNVHFTGHPNEHWFIGARKGKRGGYFLVEDKNKSATFYLNELSCTREIPSRTTLREPTMLCRRTVRKVYVFPIPRPIWRLWRLVLGASTSLLFGTISALIRHSVITACMITFMMKTCQVYVVCFIVGFISRFYRSSELESRVSSSDWPICLTVLCLNWILYWSRCVQNSNFRVAELHYFCHL